MKALFYRHVSRCFFVSKVCYCHYSQRRWRCKARLLNVDYTTFDYILIDFLFRVLHACDRVDIENYDNLFHVVSFEKADIKYEIKI